MTRRDAGARDAAGFPDDIRAAHEHSLNHRAEVLGSALCGCFQCGEVFAPVRIVEWVDQSDEEEGPTALCPLCGIDSVIGDKSGFAITSEFLARMKSFWF